MVKSNRHNLQPRVIQKVDVAVSLQFFIEMIPYSDPDTFADVELGAGGSIHSVR